MCYQLWFQALDFKSVCFRDTPFSIFRENKEKVILWQWNAGSTQNVIFMKELGWKQLCESNFNTFETDVQKNCFLSKFGSSHILIGSIKLFFYRFVGVIRHADFLLSHQTSIFPPLAWVSVNFIHSLWKTLVFSFICILSWSKFWAPKSFFFLWEIKSTSMIETESCL